MSMLILSSFCALALNVSVAESQQDTVHRYIIDNKRVENFDGSQLQGKTIKSYTVTESKNESRNVVYELHSIETADSVFFYEKNEKRIEINEKELKEGAVSIAPEKIASVQVFKPGSKEAAAYGEKGEIVIISIVNDKDDAADGKISEPLYIIDGKVSDKKDVDVLDVNKIESINVVKDRNEVKKYTDEEKSGVVYIKIKK